MTDAQTAIEIARQTLYVAAFTGAATVIGIVLAVFFYRRGRKAKKLDDIIQLVGEYRHGLNAGWSGLLALSQTSVLRFRSDGQIRDAIRQLGKITGSDPLSGFGEQFKGMDLHALFSKIISEKIDVSSLSELQKVIENVRTPRQRRLPHR
jgi:hypothetical protein